MRERGSSVRAAGRRRTGAAAAASCCSGRRGMAEAGASAALRLREAARGTLRRGPGQSKEAAPPALRVPAPHAPAPQTGSARCSPPASSSSAPRPSLRRSAALAAPPAGASRPAAPTSPRTSRWPRSPAAAAREWGGVPSRRGRRLGRSDRGKSARLRFDARIRLRRRAAGVSASSEPHASAVPTARAGSSATSGALRFRDPRPARAAGTAAAEAATAELAGGAVTTSAPPPLATPMGTSGSVSYPVSVSDPLSLRPPWRTGGAGGRAMLPPHGSGGGSTGLKSARDD